MITYDDIEEMFGQDIDTNNLLTVLWDWYSELGTKTTGDILTADVLKDVFELISECLI